MNAQPPGNGGQKNLPQETSAQKLSDGKIDASMYAAAVHAGHDAGVKRSAILMEEALLKCGNPRDRINYLEGVLGHAFASHPDDHGNLGQDVGVKHEE